MEKSIIIKESDEGMSFQIVGYTNFEALGILRFYEKDVWLKLSRMVDKSIKDSVEKRLQEEIQKQKPSEFYEQEDGVSDDWIKFDFNKMETRPIRYGKYFVHRKDGKVHWETWNGSVCVFCPSQIKIRWKQ